MRFSYLLLLSTLLTAWQSAQAAEAQTQYHVYPATMCREFAPSANSGVEFYLSSVVNNGTDRALLVCPIVNHLMAETIALIAVRFSSDSEQTFGINLLSHQSGGSGAWGDATGSATVTGSGDVWLSTSVKGHAWGYYALMVWLPPDAQVFSYRLSSTPASSLPQP